MYLVTHQDDCQMVVGNVMRVRVNPGAGEVPGPEDQDINLGRKCTCEPELHGVPDGPKGPVMGFWKE